MLRIGQRVQIILPRSAFDRLTGTVLGVNMAGDVLVKLDDKIKLGEGREAHIQIVESEGNLFPLPP